MRSINNLTDSDINSLKRIYESGNKLASRQRAHAILLNYEGMKIALVSQVLGVHYNTILNWFSGWKESGFASLTYKPGTGAKPKLDEEQIVFLTECVKQEPQKIEIAIENLREKFGVEVSKGTARRYLKKKDLPGVECEDA
jgi:transposase